MTRLEATHEANVGDTRNNWQSNYTSVHEITEQFKSFMLEHGIATNDQIIPDTLSIQRAHIVGDKRGSKNLAYRLHTDGRPSGYFTNWRGITGTWSADGKPRKLTRQEYQQIQQERKQREVEQQARHDEAAIKARLTWQQSTPAIIHPYLSKKRIQAHDARIRGNELVIPIGDAQTDEICSLQFISADGSKRFLTGGKLKGCFSFIGEPSPDQPILICEGWATGASLHEDSGHSVVIALNAGNLEPVAKVIRKLYPMAQIIVCGDNDVSGVGQLKAKEAALAIGGKVLIPEIVGCDWNDVLTMEG